MSVVGSMGPVVGADVVGVFELAARSGLVFWKGTQGEGEGVRKEGTGWVCQNLCLDMSGLGSSLSPDDACLQCEWTDVVEH